MIYLAIYFGINVGLRVLGGVNWQRPDQLLTIVWFGVSVLFFAPLVDYQEDLSTYSLVLVALSHFCFCFPWTFMRGARSVARTGSIETTVAGGWRSVVIPLWIACGLFAAMGISRTILVGRVPIISSLANLEAIRLDYLSSPFLTTAQSIELLLLYPSLVLIALIPFFWKARDHRSLFIASVGFIVMVDNSLQFGSRATIIFSTLSIGFTYTLINRLAIRRVTVIALVASFLILVLGSSFMTARNSAFERAPAVFLSHNCAGGRLDPLVDGADTSVVALALSSCYVTSTFSYLDIAVEASTSDISRQYGAYDFGIIFRSSFDQSRDQFANVLRREGYTTNPWATSVSYAWVDFGIFAPIFYLFLGLALRRGLRLSDVSNPLIYARVAFLRVWIVFIPFLSPLVLPALVYPVVAAIGLSIAHRALVSSRPSAVGESARILARQVEVRGSGGIDTWGVEIAPADDQVA